MLSVAKRKYTSLSIDKKLEILNSLVSKSKSKRQLTEQYGCDSTTIGRIVRQEGKIRKIAMENGNTARIRFRIGKYEELDQAVAIWFWQMRSKNAIISGPMIKEQAKKLARELKISDFEPSNGWLGRWKRKQNVGFHKLQGEKGSSDQASASQRVKNALPTLLAGYDPKDIYNADESGLLYNALPDGTMAAKNGEMTLQQILDELRHQRNERIEEEEEEAQPQTQPSPTTRQDALTALTVLRAYFEQEQMDLKNMDALEDQFCAMSAPITIKKSFSDYSK